MELLHASLQSSPLGELRGNDRVAKQHALQRVEEVVAPRVAGRDVVLPALQELFGAFPESELIRAHPMLQAQNRAKQGLPKKAAEPHRLLQPFQPAEAATACRQVWEHLRSTALLTCLTSASPEYSCQYDLPHATVMRLHSRGSMSFVSDDAP